ncbi:G-protein coupled receptor 4-like [Elgaria multicarinata webbii]|uniref:G-protein coupled receptor 4-like n=1 Tax=Elgaria multicarinata webbii TaxID=159646 RepID=UPI002FCCCA79
MNTINITCPMAFNTTKYFTIPMYSLALAAGLPLNCLALLALVSHIQKSIVLSVYVLNVVLANILQSLMLPFWINYSYHNHHWNLGEGACMVFGVIFFTNFYAKNNFLCLIAMERYIGLIYPLKFYRLQTMHGATKVSIGAWLLVAILCVAGVWIQMHGSETWQGRCLDGSQSGKDYAYFKMATMSFSFFMPCFLMGFFYFRVLFALRKKTSLQQRLKRKIYGFISLIIASFFLLCTPYQVISCYKYYCTLMLENNEFCDIERNSFIYIHVTWCLAILTTILDPLLYILLLKDVQANLKDHLSFRARRTQITQDLPLHSTTGWIQKVPVSQ